nr:hypothetical protein [Tanacetum cinerariifolium]
MSPIHLSGGENVVRIIPSPVENGVNILKSIDEGPFRMGTLTKTLTERTEGAPHLGPEPPRVYSDLTTEEKERYNAEIQMLSEGSKLTKKDRESQLYDDFEPFQQNKGETIHEYYVWFAKLINDMRIKMTISMMQLNSKFVNNMFSEWGRFVTAVKLNRGLRNSNYDQLYAYLKQHEAHASESKMMLDRFTQHIVDPLALMNQATIQDGRVVVQNVQGRRKRGHGNNARGAGVASYGGAQNRVGYANPDKMLLMQAHENGVALDEKQLLFIAGGQDNVVDEDVDEQPVQDLALNVDNVFQADDCDAFDSDVDEAPTAQTMFMENLSSADLVYDEAGSSYDSDILSKVHDHDHYQDAVCEHHEVHEMHDDVQPNYIVDSHTDYTSDSNMIPYDQYVKDNVVPVVQSNVSSVPNVAYMMILNDMHEQPAQHVSVTKKNNLVDKSLTAKLAIYKEQVELFMNYLEEQTDGEAMINSIKNGDQPLPRVTQMSIAGTTSTEQPHLKEKSMWSDQEKRVQKIDRLARSLLIQGLSNDIYSLIDSNKTAKDLWDALARHIFGFEYVINDLKKCGYLKDNCELNFKFLNNLQPKKNVVVASDPLALIAEKIKVSKSKEKVVVSSDSEGSDADDFSKLKKITALLEKAFNQRKFYSKPTNNNLRTSSTSQSANKKQEFVKNDNKTVEKKDDEKKRDMNRVKCYNCKKEGHFAKDCKKVKVKDYEYYKTKMLLAKKDKDEQVLLAKDQAWMESSSDLDQKINKNMVFMAQIKKVLSDSEASSLSADEKISEVSYYLSEFETSEYYDNSTDYGLFVNNNDDQEIFHDTIESASENFIENHIDSQKDYDKSDVDHNDSEEKEHLCDKLIRKFNKKIVKCQKRIEKANQQSKDFENQNKNLQDKYDVLKNQTTTFEIKNKELNEQLKELIKMNNDLLAQTKVLKEQLQIKHVVIDTHAECQEKYAKLKAERYEYMIRYSAYFDNDKQHRKQIADQEV